MESSNSFLGLLRRRLAKLEPILLWIMSAILAYDFLLQGIRKLEPTGWWAPSFAKWGYPVWFMVFVGIVEVGGGIALLIPKIRHFGGIALTIIMIGAVITKAMHKLSFDEVIFFVNTIVLLLLLVGYRFNSTQPSNS